jgi:hypothetical protein
VTRTPPPALATVTRTLLPALAAVLLLTSGCGLASFAAGAGAFGTPRFDPAPATAANVVGTWSGPGSTTFTGHADGTFTGHRLTADGPPDSAGRWVIDPADQPDVPPTLVLGPGPGGRALSMFTDRGQPLLCVQDDPDAPCDQAQFTRRVTR